MHLLVFTLATLLLKSVTILLCHPVSCSHSNTCGYTCTRTYIGTCTENYILVRTRTYILVLVAMLVRVAILVRIAIHVCIACVN